MDRQPKGTYELVAGRVVVEAMAPGPIRHARTKMAAWLALREAIRPGRSGCEAFVDGIGMQVGSDTIRIPSVRHYLILDPESRVVLHQRRDIGGAVQSAILGTAPLTRDPPGITVQVESLFED